MRLTMEILWLKGAERIGGRPTQSTRAPVPSTIARKSATRDWYTLRHSSLPNNTTLPSTTKLWPSLAPIATMTTSGFSEPSNAGYWSIQLKTSGRANPVPDLKARKMRRFLSSPAFRIRPVPNPTAIMESPVSATRRDLPCSIGASGVRLTLRGTLSTIGATAAAARLGFDSRPAAPA